MVDIKEQCITKPDMVKAYKEIEKLENRKEHLKNLYCLKYDLPPSQLKEVLVSGGTKTVDAILNKILKSDEMLDEIITINQAIASWTDYLNKEIELYFKNDDLTPLIVFLKDHRDLETKRVRTFADVAKIVYTPEPTVKRKYYEYKNGLSSTNDTIWYDTLCYNMYNGYLYKTSSNPFPYE